LSRYPRIYSILRREDDAHTGGLPYKYAQRRHLQTEYEPEMKYRAHRAQRVGELYRRHPPAESDKLAWIRSHALRKTTATALDQAGHTACQIADQLGHAKVSITQDTYLARQTANPAAAQALEQAFDDPGLAWRRDSVSSTVQDVEDLSGAGALLYRLTERMTIARRVDGILSL
jgi:hypothetical protein